MSFRVGLLKFFAVFVSFLLVWYLAQLELELAAQFILGLILTSLVLLLTNLPVSEKLEVKLFVLFLGAFLAFRYIIWRTTSTIVFTNIWDFVPMILLYVAEVYGFAVFAFGLFINVLPLDRKEKAPVPSSPDEYPFVDILIPTYTEPLDVVKITAIGCTLMDYPRSRFRIFVLDDGATLQRLSSPDPKIRKAAEARRQELSAFCHEAGVEYRTRRDNSNAKAGNINAVLPQCQGDLLLILDCDHVPTRDFLIRTVGFFQNDPALFLVQTPHFMINANPVEKNLGLFADAPSESEMFYGVIQRGLDFWNSSFFCGSAAVLRRSFLEQIGGISGVTVTEDAETSLQLHAMSLKSMYFADPVSSGLSPETFVDFIKQRTRWAQGMIQIFLLNNPIIKRGLKLYQRIGYANSSLFWFFGLARAMFIISPLLYLFFGLHIYMASVPQVIAYTLPFLVSSFCIGNFIFGKYRWPLFSELYETAQSFFLLPAVVSVLLNPKKPHFRVTPKGQSLSTDFLSPLAWPLVYLFGVCLLAIPFAFYRWHVTPFERDVVMICSAWLVFHMLLLIMSIGSVYERHQLRRHPRTWAYGYVKVKMDSVTVASCKVKDLSFGGMGAIMEGEPSLGLGDRVNLHVRDSYGNEYTINAKVIRIDPDKGDKVNLAFEFLINSYEEFKDVVAYVYGDSLRWKLYQERKRKKVPLIKGVLYLVRHGFTGARYALGEIIEITIGWFKNKFYFGSLKEERGL